jgi:hypothetical protein
MDKLLTTIESTIQSAINNYISTISKNYDIDEKELHELWGSNLKTATKTKASTKKESDGGCVYKYIKGKQEGQMCGKNVKADSKYCSKHAKFETDGQKEKKSVIPKEEVNVNKSKLEKCIRYNKDINKWWHQETKLIFKSNLDKVVVGIYRNETVENLTDDDCKVCEQYGFKYLKNELEKKVEEPVKKVEKKIEEPVRKVEKKIEEPVRKVEKKIEEPVKKVEKKIETVLPKKKISEQIMETNFYAKNVEDVIGDMLDEVDDDDEVDELEEEVLEEEDDIDEED